MYKSRTNIIYRGLHARPATVHRHIHIDYIMNCGWSNSSLCVQLNLRSSLSVSAVDLSHNNFLLYTIVSPLNLTVAKISYATGCYCYFITILSLYSVDCDLTQMCDCVYFIVKRIRLYEAYNTMRLLLTQGHFVKDSWNHRIT